MLITKEHFKRIYENNTIGITNLAFIIDNACNANCKACIAKHVFKSSLCKEVCEGYATCKHIRCCDHAATDEEFYTAVEEILATVTSPYVDIVITGGEPTLSHRFLPILEIIAKHDYPAKSISIETNGAKLGDADVAEAIKKYNIQIHLSRYSTNEEKNREEFGYTDNETTNEDLKAYAETYGNLLCVNTVMLKKNIPSATELLNMVTELENLGVRHHEFVEVMADVTLEQSNKELIAYYNEQLITAEQLRKELADIGVKELYAEYGEAMGVSIHEYNGVQFSMMYSKLDKQHLVVPNNEARKFLIMPSGEIGVDGIEKE